MSSCEQCYVVKIERHVEEPCWPLKVSTSSPRNIATRQVSSMSVDGQDEFGYTAAIDACTKGNESGAEAWGSFPMVENQRCPHITGCQNQNHRNAGKSRPTMRYTL